MNVDPAFGHWLAGFTDGEGCFLINHYRKTYSCAFSIQLRADDNNVLEHIQEQLGFGRLFLHTSVNKSNRNPRSVFHVSTKDGCVLLRNLFLTYPLRAKKARDFEIWTEALDFWLTVYRRHDDNGRMIPWDNWTVMAEAKERLELNRKFTKE